MRKFGPIAIAAFSLIVFVACSSNSTTNTTSPGGVTIPTSTSTGTPGAIDVTEGETSATQMYLNLSAATAPAGKVTFTVVNEGDKKHEFVVLRTDTPADEIAIGSFEGESDRINEEGGGQENVGETGDIDAGATKTLTLTLTAGHYVVVCNLQHHFAMGMRTDFTVA
jgi:uncharacterized cupredoxin-like copper-binding protein